jgi:hypothetical protein
MHFVGGIGIPNYELSILRGGNEMSSVRRPVHGIDLCKMTLENTARFHANSRKLFCCALSNATDYVKKRMVSLCKSFVRRISIARLFFYERAPIETRHKTHEWHQRDRPSFALFCPLGPRHRALRLQSLPASPPTRLVLPL